VHHCGSKSEFPNKLVKVSHIKFDENLSNGIQAGADGQAESVNKCECFKVICVLERFVKNCKNVSNIYRQICGKHGLSLQACNFSKHGINSNSICCSQGLALKQ
jgi:hypothetical protein